ncbi:type VI secretion system lipoprotein TssJ [Burkholderia pyrrocinia]|uniref:type VI secretion system lipoprotein TssJ n=1 Tax=Burkholderia pyrrocinia TaxID=60550 RepID=UPI00215ACA79|nr:type VI secretion system lipoprotein TssJ [Burkholderia pyrrocinia]UVE68534.1 type VI secretion system lipoprotein TssJ [Burkholderia pyrrocinia]
MAAWIMLRCTVAVGLALAVSACGMWQSVKDTTVDATRAVFVAKVKHVNLAVESHATLKQNGQGQSLPVVIRIYQLKDAKAFAQESYTQLLDDGRALLKADLLGSPEVTLAPGVPTKLSAPRPDDAQFVGVIGFFRDQGGAEWQLVIPKSQWKKTDPVRLVVNGNRLELDARH